MIEHIIIGIIIGIVVLLIVFLVVMMVKRHKTPKNNTPIIDCGQLIAALGTNANIIDVTNEQKRIKIKLKDPSLIDQEAIKNIVISAFLVGNELKILVKENVDAVYQTLLLNKGG